MRLGQLARKLDVRPAEIADFLARHNSVIEVGTNVRLDENQVVLVMQHFAPVESGAPELPAQSGETPAKQAEAVDQIAEKPTGQDEAEGTAAEKPELIKAPKVELAGLKVLGKIDLPELKKKEEKPAEGQPEATPETAPKGNGRRPFHKKEFQKPRPGKNPVVLQREREAREAERKKKELTEERKQKQRDHYLNKMKTVPTQVKAVKKVDEPLEEITPGDAEPVSRWKRFIRWWNT